eukprot:7698967-Pyramimonas_sp.AAC.1
MYFTLGSTFISLYTAWTSSPDFTITGPMFTLKSGRNHQQANGPRLSHSVIFLAIELDTWKRDQGTYESVTSGKNEGGVQAP